MAEMWVVGGCLGLGWEWELTNVQRMEVGFVPPVRWRLVMVRPPVIMTTMRMVKNSGFSEMMMRFLIVLRKSYD
ncbi:hypothetical protein Hanom_Chr14g01308831 [Helianthus anomalus]